MTPEDFDFRGDFHTLYQKLFDLSKHKDMPDGIQYYIQNCLLDKLDEIEKNLARCKQIVLVERS